MRTSPMFHVACLAICSVLCVIQFTIQRQARRTRWSLAMLSLAVASLSALALLLKN